MNKLFGFILMSCLLFAQTVAASSGSPDPLGIMDSDGDGVFDSMDACPEESGEIRNFGCPGKECTFWDIVALSFLVAAYIAALAAAVAATVATAGGSLASLAAVLSVPVSQVIKTLLLVAAVYGLGSASSAVMSYFCYLMD